MDQDSEVFKCIFEMRTKEHKYVKFSSWKFKDS